ncbi:Uncharacterised protein [Vibrio cholerae]|nr:Uncharacterised protein [Vibrio cholerae]
MASQCEPPLPQESTFPPCLNESAISLAAASICAMLWSSLKNFCKTSAASVSSLLIKSWYMRYLSIDY